MDRARTEESELRNVTVMFADISGFTALSETISAEEVTSIMNRCFDLMSPIIRENEGHIDKYIGDCVMVLFGAPTTVENAPMKAVNAAIAIRNSIQNFSKSLHLPSPIDIHIGINSGKVLAGSIGSSDRKQFTVVGDPVNLASRLEDHSDPGQILIGDSTYKATHEIFEYNPLKPIAVKGKREAVQVYELLSRQVTRPKTGRHNERMIQAEMIGREKELAAILDTCCFFDENRGEIVTVIGEAGMGKSRLIAETRNKMPADIKLVEGRSLSHGKNLSFHPFNEIIKTLAKIEEEDSQPKSIEKIKTLLEECDPTNLENSLPFLAKFLGLEIPDEYRNIIAGIEGEILARTIAVHLKRLISQISSIAPLVVILEDAHWADSSSIKLMESMFNLVRDYRILFIVIFRPGYEETGIVIQTILNEQFPEDYVEIQLSHLDASNSDDLIYGLLRTTGIPQSIREQIRTRSEGNPFFIEEILRSFIDEGIIELQNGEFTITPAIDNVVIPHTIQELLMARIDRLDGNIKSLVKTASVIGRTFYQKIIVEVAASINDILGKLDYLQEVQFLKEGMREDEIEYLFKHALIQKSAYESILLQTRKELHNQVAEAIERVFKEKLPDYFGMLAYHYSNAENLEKAEEYMLKAGEEALNSSASGEAIQYFSDALEIYRKIHGKNADPDRILMMNKKLALACLYWGNQRNAVHYLDEVLRYYGFRFNYKPYRYMLFFLQCIFLLYFPVFAWKKMPETLDYEIADLLMLRSNILATSMPERMIENFLLFKWLTKFNPLKFSIGADMFSMLSVMSSYGGVSFKLSVKTLKHINDKITDTALLKVMYNEFANRMHNFLCGEWREIKPFNSEIPPLYIKNDKYMYASFYQNMYQLFFIERGDYQMAAKISNDMLQINETYGYKGIAETSTSKVYAKFRKLSDAEKSADDAISQSARLGASQYLYSAYCIKARILIHRGDFPGAKNMLSKANEAASDIVPMYKTDFDTASLLCDVALLEQAMQSESPSPVSALAKNASRSCKSAIKTCRMAAMDRVEVYKLTGIYHWLLNRQKKAIQWWQKSIACGEYMEAKLELSRTYFEVGKRLSEPNSRLTTLNGISASEYLSMAKKMFDEMDLSWDIEQMIDGRITGVSSDDAQRSQR